MPVKIQLIILFFHISVNTIAINSWMKKKQNARQNAHRTSQVK